MRNNKEELYLRIIKIIFGFFMIGIGNALMLKANFGMNAWNTLDHGIAIFFNISFGKASRYLGMVIIIADILLGMIPGFGTILNILCIGFFTDIWLNVFNDIILSNVFIRFIIFILGVAIAAVFSGFYISLKLGTGPRDGFSILLTKKLNIEFSKFRVGIEIFAVVVGFLLGATVGIGTIISALLNGPIIGRVMKYLDYNPAKEKQENILDVINLYFR